MWVESPDEISSKFWRSLLHPPPPPPGEWQRFVWNRSASISLFFFLSTFFLFFLSFFLSISHSHHQHLYTDIPSGKSSLPSAALEHTLFHAWSWHAHPWCDLTWSLQRHHLFSQQFPHFTICIPPLYESKAPWALACLPAVSQGHDYWTWSSSGTDELQRHGERVEDGVGKAWALETGWDSRKIENTWDYSPCAVLLSLRLFSLTCWIKLSFVSAFTIIKSLPLSYYLPYCLSALTKTPAFLTLSCLPISVSSGIFMKPLGVKKILWGQQKHKGKGGQRPRSGSWQRYAGAHRMATEPQFQCPAWSANAQSENHLWNSLGMKVKLHYTHQQKRMTKIR